MSALWIAHVKVTDVEQYSHYAAAATVAINQHGGTFIARGNKHIQLEGKDTLPRHVIVRFESIEAATQCYFSPEYQEALALTEGACERTLVLVETNET